MVHLHHHRFGVVHSSVLVRTPQLPIPPRRNCLSLRAPVPARGLRWSCWPSLLPVPGSPHAPFVQGGCCSARANCSVRWKTPRTLPPSLGAPPPEGTRGNGAGDGRRQLQGWPEKKTESSPGFGGLAQFGNISNHLKRPEAKLGHGRNGSIDPPVIFLPGGIDRSGLA